MLMTHWTEFKDYHGLKAGDMLLIKKTGKLVRYIGVSYGGIPDTPYDKMLLEFCQPFPVHPFNHCNQNLVKTYYLAIKESSSQGFINPSTIKDLKNLEGICFLNKYIKDTKKDFEKVGNIPNIIWLRMEQEAPIYSVNGKIQ